MSGEGATRPLAIICGGGAFPLEVARAAAATGASPFLVGLVGASDPGVEAFPHVWLHLGQVGKLFAELAARGIAEVALVGALTRPEFADLRFDWGALKRAPELAKAFRGGDNRLLSGIAAVFEGEGFKVVGAHEIAPQLVASLGALGARVAPASAEMDIQTGAATIAALSPFDAGQGVVVAEGRILAIEAAEGTDAMLARVAEMRASRRLKMTGPAGVFVKAPKRGQDLRLDMPAIGPRTIAAAIEAQLLGIAVVAGSVLIAERESTLRAADAAGLFITGFVP
ncbi:MAG: LpxI family protein [Bradyrhizobium sp.]|nr:MAG: LpxI family protein [Bradyrhizobium sp.]